MSSLSEFATSKVKPKCPVCLLPVVAEVNAGRAQGITYPVIREWLETAGHAVMSEDQIRRHFRSRHDQVGK